MMMSLSPIILDSVEGVIFGTLKEFAQKHSLKVTLRVAGGWVRDKLLGNACHDLDIALDTMTGESFARRLHDYLQSVDRTMVSSFGIIQVNPEQSKHLEAATLCILGRPIDFVNLRSEDYSQDSRIPTTNHFGSPEEDALRRDLTINALFYNLTTGQVEDLTGHGVADIRSGIIRTPLCPLVTLTDDPLRLLRAIRFAARFQYQIVPELEAAMLQPQVFHAFMNKVSRERVGIEIEKICSHKHRLCGLQLMARIKSVYPMILGRMPAAIEEAHDLFCILIDRLTDSTTILLNREGALALLCLPFTNVKYQMVKGTKRSTEEPVSMHIMKESLKLSNKDALTVYHLVEHAHDLYALYTTLLNDSSEHDSSVHDSSEQDSSSLLSSEFIVKLGRLIRVIGKDWREAIALSGLYHDVCMQRLTERVESLGLQDAWNWKPLLSGDDIKQLRPGIDPKLIGQMTSRILDWQYLNPSGDKQSLIDELKNDSNKATL